MKMSAKDVQTVANLSRLKIADTEEANYAQELEDFLQYVDVLSKVDTEGVKPMAHVLPLQNVFREDVVKPSLARDLALSNAPEQENGYFKVPRILE